MRSTTESAAASIQFLNDKQLSALLGVSTASVRRWRLLGLGPRYLKVGASVRYRVEDLEAWLASRPAGGERAEQ